MEKKKSEELKAKAAKKTALADDVKKTETSKKPETTKSEAKTSAKAKTKPETKKNAAAASSAKKATVAGAAKKAAAPEKAPAKSSAEGQKKAEPAKQSAATLAQKKPVKKRTWIALAVAAVVAIVAGIVVWAVLAARAPEPEPVEPAPDESVSEPEIPEEPEPEEPAPEEPEQPSGNNGGGNGGGGTYSRAPGEPRWMSIPSIGVNNATVIGIGTLADGTLDGSYAPQYVAWYVGSSLPGKAGVSLINAHGGDLGVGIFKNLPRVAVGAEIYVTTVDGHQYTYVVREKVFKHIGAEADNYMPTAMTVPVPGVPAMTLITCTGTWIRAQQTYDQRLFVRATLKD